MLRKGAAAVRDEGGLEERRTLCGQLELINTSGGFLLLVIASVLLSFQALTIQRRGLCLTILGDTQGAAALPDVFPIRWKAGGMVVGALGFFLCAAIYTLKQAQRGGDGQTLRSARANMAAALLVFLAALIRLEDLACARGQTGEEILPE